MSGQPVASEQATPEQMAARMAGERLAMRNHLRRRIDCADTLDDLRGVEESLELWEYADDIQLNEQFERRWSALDRQGR